MKVGVCEATELKKRSEMLSIPFADLLWGYAVEDLMLRVSTSAYREFLLSLIHISEPTRPY